MQKVVYSVSKVNHRDEKSKGVGYVADNNLLMPCLSRNGKAYIKVFDIRKCRATDETNSAFSGNITVAYTDVPIPRDTKQDDSSKDVIDYLEIEYFVWFKFVD
ncbi:MAG: hypothetical protein ACI4R8_03590 [Candidatus Caccovivens sp.]